MFVCLVVFHKDCKFMFGEKESEVDKLQRYQTRPYFMNALPWGHGLYSYFIPGSALEHDPCGTNELSVLLLTLLMFPQAFFPSLILTDSCLCSLDITSLSPEQNAVFFSSRGALMFLVTQGLMLENKTVLTWDRGVHVEAGVHCQTVCQSSYVLIIK